MELGKALDLPAKKEKQFHRKKITTTEDLFAFFPRNYYDYSKDTGLQRERVALILSIFEIYSGTSKSGISYIIAKGNYHGLLVTVMWFQSSYLLREIAGTKGCSVFVAGKLSCQDGYLITNPDIYSLTPAFGIYPVYSKIAGMSDDYLKENIKKVFSLFSIPSKGNLPYLAEKMFGLISYEKAVCNLHFPKTMQDVEEAKKRLLYDDLYAFAYIMAKEEKRKKEKSFVHIKKDLLYQSTLANLPYTLTKDQNDTLLSIVESIKNQNRVHALIQGDVGCGKTIVATLVMALLAENGYQSVLLAPTAVLAKQHYQDLSGMLPDVGFVPPLSGLKKKEKNAILEDISTGKYKILIGTHALLSDEIRFKKLGLIITDEEHKFGVEQREKLLKSAEEGVHYITMSATPIPRSLASILYGESTSLHCITTMPKGRLPVQTAINSNFETCCAFIKKQIEEGHQVYVVCPMIDSNEKMEDVSSVQELSKMYGKVFGEEKIGVLTGRNSKKEMEEILKDFQNNKRQILIATTVIEVGVNVPNATTIVIHNAERFGLAGLHQLRGRVGRGGGKAYCILFSEEKQNERLLVMCKTNNGFVIAEEDLKLRGAGELLGTEQSGISHYTNQVIEHPDDYQNVLSYVKKYLYK